MYKRQLYLKYNYTIRESLFWRHLKAYKYGLSRWVEAKLKCHYIRRAMSSGNIGFGCQKRDSCFIGLYH